jgi:hypothetical protein
VKSVGLKKVPQRRCMRVTISSCVSSPRAFMAPKAFNHGKPSCLAVHKGSAFTAFAMAWVPERPVPNANTGVLTLSLARGGLSRLA